MLFQSLQTTKQADILSNPVALDLLSLDNKERNLELIFGISWNSWWSDGRPLR